MKLTSACAGSVATLIFVAGLSAQTTPAPAAKPETSGGTPIVTVGCVNRAVPTGSLAPGSGAPSATPETAQTLANSTDLINVFLLADAKTAGATGEVSSRAANGEPVKTLPTTYVLDGTRQQLEGHTGHRVEVTGTLRTAAEGDKANKTAVAHIRVASIKMLASTCPKDGVAAH